MSSGEALEHLPEEVGTGAAARAVLEGRKKGLLAVLPFLGPAFIACVAYIDPANFATNIQGGSAFGYNLRLLNNALSRAVRRRRGVSFAGASRTW